MAIEQYSEPEFDLEPGDIVVAPARADRRTKELVKRLCPGEIAIIDHADIDRVAAENLIRAAPSAVVNASTSFTGRYPLGLWPTDSRRSPIPPGCELSRFCG